MRTLNFGLSNNLGRAGRGSISVATRLPVTDYTNGFELPGSTFSGGPTVVEDHEGTLVTSPASVLPIEWMRLTDGVFYPTDSSGDPIHASTPLRTTKGTVQKYAETYKGPLIEPARTNLFLNSTVPVTRNITTTAQQYTVTVKGTGSITLSGTATGVATDGSPLTVTATAGTLTCTVAGTLSRVNVEAGAFGTSFITTGATTVTRPAGNWTRPTAGTALEGGNDFAIYGRVIPMAGGQGVVYPFASFVDSNNTTYTVISAGKLYFQKKILGVTYTPAKGVAFTNEAWQTIEYLAYQHSVYGMGIMVREYSGDSWGAWSDWVTGAYTQDIPIASTYQIGARNNANHFAANYPFTEIIELPLNQNPQTWLMDQLDKGRI